MSSRRSAGSKPPDCAALQHTHPEDGRSVDDWAQLYVYALGVLPLFDASSIPAHLIVNSKGRCFLVRALAHPDDRIGRAAAGHGDLTAIAYAAAEHGAVRCAAGDGDGAAGARVGAHPVATRE